MFHFNSLNEFWLQIQNNSTFQICAGMLVFFASPPKAKLNLNTNVDNNNTISKTTFSGKLEPSSEDISGCSGAGFTDDCVATHVAIISGVDENARSLKIIHAAQDGVREEDIESYCKRQGYSKEKPKILLFCKMKQEEESSTDCIITTARSHVGARYNDLMTEKCIDSEGHKAFYCCQLIRFVYNEVLGENTFPTRKMKFGTADNPDGVSNFWKEYYQQRNHRVPLGETGSHPNDFLKADILDQICCVEI